jgi:hypothetical protein
VSLAFSRHCRAGQGIEDVSVEDRKGRDFTNPPLDWVERGVRTLESESELESSEAYSRRRNGETG